MRAARRWAVPGSLAFAGVKELRSYGTFQTERDLLSSNRNRAVTAGGAAATWL